MTREKYAEGWEERGLRGAGVGKDINTKRMRKGKRYMIKRREKKRERKKKQ